MGIFPAKDPGLPLPNTRCSAIGIDEHKIWRLNVFGWGAAVEEGSSRAIRREVKSASFLLSNGRRADAEIAATL
jgi:hypothetical protein